MYSTLFEFLDNPDIRRGYLTGRVAPIPQFISEKKLFLYFVRNYFIEVNEMKKLFSLIALSLLFLSPTTALARGGHAHSHSHSHSHSRSHSSGKSSSKSSSKSHSSSKSSSHSSSSRSTRNGFRIFGSKPRSRVYVPSTPVQSWKKIPQSNITTPVDNGFVYPSLTQRLLFMPRPIVHSTNQSDDFSDDDGSKKFVTVITVIFAVAGLIGLTMHIKDRL